MLPSLQAPEEDHGVARGWDCGLPVIGGCWGWAGKYTVGKWLETLQVTSCRGLKISSFGSQGRWVHCCWAPYLSLPAKEPALSCSQQKHQQDVVAPGGKVTWGLPEVPCLQGWRPGVESCGSSRSGRVRNLLDIQK